jgi:hypothetical protein
LPFTLIYNISYYYMSFLEKIGDIKATLATVGKEAVASAKLEVAKAAPQKGGGGLEGHIYGGGMRRGGMRHGGTRHGGMRHGGTRHGGMRHGGTRHGGMRHGGTHRGGTRHIGNGGPRKKKMAKVKTRKVRKVRRGGMSKKGGRHGGTR